MATDWWSRKLTNTPQAPSRPTSLPSTPPVRIGTQIQFPKQFQEAPPQERVLDEQRAPTEEVSMGDAIRLWKGGEAHRKEGNMSCPDCGSHNVFGRTAKSGNTTIQGKSPAPRCFECGWTGLYHQGDQANWAT